MSSLFRSQKPGVTPPPEKIGQIGIAGQGSEFGTVDPETGEFISTPGQTFQRTTESGFQEQFRLGQEGLQTQLLGSLSGQLTDPRSAQTIRGILPSAQRQIGVGRPQAGQVGVETGGFTGLPELGQDFSADISRLEEASFQGVAQRLAPGFEDQRRRLGQQLADQGIPIGSEAFERELTRQETGQGEILSRAALDAVQAGRQEHGRLAGLEQSQRGQLFGEQFNVRGQEFGQQLASQQQSFQQQFAARGQEEAFRSNQLQDALQKQLSLASLEQQQRGQQFGELGALGGFVSPFAPTPVQAVGAGSTGARSAGEGFALLGAALGGR